MTMDYYGLNELASVSATVLDVVSLLEKVSITYDMW